MTFTGKQIRHGPETLKQALENFQQRCTDADRCKYRNRRIWYQRLFKFENMPESSSGRGRDERTVVYTGDYGIRPVWATNAFGQNFNVTMTQMAASFCSLLNGGNYYEPHVKKQIQDGNGNVTENKDPVLVKKNNFKRDQ